MAEKRKPEIRFRGFTDEWEQRKVSDLAEKTHGGGTPATSNGTFWEGNIPWIQSSDIADGQLFGIVPRKYITEEGLNKSAAQLVPENSIAVIIRVGVGKLAFMPFSYATSQDFLSLSKLTAEPQFTVYALYKKLKSELNAVQGTSIKGITKDELLVKEIMIPNFPEQKIIGSFFKHLDHLITLHQRKYEKLQKVKKSMLEKMFPKNGSKVPEIRFRGFTDDWEQRKLGEMSSLITKGTTPLDKSNTGTVNFVKIESIDESSGEITITQKISLDEHNGYLRRSQLKENDLLFSIAGTLGRVTSIKSSILPANTNQALAIIRLKEGCLEYVKTYLKGKAVTDYIRKNPTIGAQPNLSLEQVSNLKIAIPSEVEQEQLGNFFNHLDHLITLHQRKLEKLRNLKKACLEKMFV